MRDMYMGSEIGVSLPIIDSATTDKNVWSAEKINNELENKVDKIEGKQLSTNDYANEDKAVVDSTPIKNAIGENLELDTSKGGIKFNKIVGKTHKSKNVMEAKLQTTTTNEVTCTRNSDGSYVINGTNNTESTIYFNVNTNIPFVEGTRYKVVGLPPNVNTVGLWVRTVVGITPTTVYARNGEQFTPTTNMYVYISVPSGASANNLLIKPMITTDLDATYDDFEPFGVFNSGEMGLVDLGSLNWTKYTSQGGKTYYSSNGVSTNIKKNINNNTVYPYRITADNYTLSPTNTNATYTSTTTPNDVFTVSANGDISIYSDMKPIGLLAYELADGATPSQYAEVIKEHGKNLWDENWSVGGLGDVGQDYNSSTTIRTQSYILVEPNKNYFVTVNDVKYVFFYNKDKNYISSKAIQTNAYFTTPSNCYYVRVAFSIAYGNAYKNDIAIIEGTSGLYIPYTESTSFIPLAEPLHSINDIYDTIDKEVLTRRIGKLDMGDLNWVYTSASNSFYVLASNLPVKYDAHCLCNMFEDAWGVPQAQMEDYTIKFDTSGNLNLTFRDVTNANDLKAKLAGEYLYYVLKTPIATSLTTDQIKALHSLKAFEDKTYIDTVDTYAKATLDVDYANIVSSLIGEDNELRVESADVNAKLADKASGVYSTDEIIVGTWLGNKPIYRKVYELTDPSVFPKSTAFKVADLPTDFGMLIKGFAILKTYENSYTNNDILVYSTTNGIMSKQDFSGYAEKMWVTVEYTKTTD